MTNAMGFFEDLEDDFSKVETKPAKNPVWHECTTCAGKGTVVKVYGYSPMTQKAYTKKCPACAGRGGFKTSETQRKHAKMKANAKKKATLQEAQDGFNEQHPEMIAKLQKMVGWNNFAASLVAQFTTKGFLTEKQVTSVEKMFAKMESKKNDEPTQEIYLVKIIEMFNVAKENGKKRPKFTAEGLTLSLAGATSANAGAVYVKTGDTYIGKVMPNGKYYPTSAAPNDAEKKLQEISNAPLEYAVKYGRETGVCACCGRTLTDSESVKQGIGPICIQKWGF